MKPGRNDPCPCGSGKKYKKCCQDKRSQGAGPQAGVENRATDAHLKLGQLIQLVNAGRFGEAEAAAQLMLKQHSDAGVAWKILGVSLVMQGKDGLAALQKAAALLPTDADLQNHLGMLLTAKKCYSEAIVSFQRAQQIKPDYVETYYNLNIVYMAQGRLSDAESVLLKALAIKPDYLMTHYGLGLVFKAQGQELKAEASLLHALSIKPDFSGGHYCLGYLYMEQGRSSEAEHHFLSAIKIDPHYSEARNKLGLCYAEQGRFVDAEACYRETLKVNPDDLDARFNLAVIKKTDEASENLAALIRLEKAGKDIQSDKDAAMLNYALGKSFEDCGDYEKAFLYFQEGARRKRASFSYDAQKTAERFNKIPRIFDKATLEKLGKSGYASTVPIFIVGMPRSGTTLIEQIISSHPEVYGAGELPDLLEISTGVIGGGEAGFPDRVGELTPERLVAIGRAYVTRLQRRAPDALRITDKMPVNFIAAGLIHLILPNAKIIHVKRNPADTCVSCFTQLFQGGMEFSYDLTELGSYYLEYTKLMAHWRTALPDSAFIEVDYEGVVSEPEAQARRVIEFCGLEWNDACLEFYTTNRTVKTASVAQVRQPIYRTSVARWRRYEQHLSPLLIALEG